VVTPRSAASELLDRADLARAAGRGEVAARLYDEAAGLCRGADDLEGWTRSVLGAASVHAFGTEPGRLPAQLYDVLVRTSEEPSRARLSAALARCWAYAGQPRRASRFADEAVAVASRVGDEELLTDCLDAALAAQWGPDELPARVALTRRLDEVAAHVADPEARLRAHLWGLQTAWELLDLHAVNRHLRALEALGQESDRALFFAASRRLMLDLLRSRADTADTLLDLARAASERASLADAWIVLEAQRAYAAVVAGDVAAASAGAAMCEALGKSEGSAVICAEAIFLWVGAGRLDRTAELLHTFRGSCLDDLPRDVNWLLTLQCVLEGALAVQDRELTQQCFALLAPYPGRAVINAGAVMLHGVTDDTLARAATLLGDQEAARALRETASRTYARLGAVWWRDRLDAFSGPTTPPPTRRSAHLHPIPGGLWLVGCSSPQPVAGLRGFSHLRTLLSRPHRPVEALDLVGSGGAVNLEHGLGPIIDDQARAAYQARLGELDRELAEAEEWSDLARIDLLRDEQQALLDEIRRATGLGSRPRVSGSSRERARVAVRKTITTAISRIEQLDPELGTHLRGCVHTGAACSYDPPTAHGLEWIID